MEKQLKFTVQLITESGRWPAVGAAFVNGNGSISVLLRDGVTVTGGQKLYLRAVPPKAQETASAGTEA